MQDGGMEVKALDNRPKLKIWVHNYWDGFQVLSSSRSIHQGGVGPIPLSEIVAYMEAINLFDVDRRLTFIKMIQGLDNVYVSHINDKAKLRAERQARANKRK